MQLPGLKLYRKLRYRKGFGIHSPFVYNLVTKVVEEKSLYYAFEEIEKFRVDLLSREDSLSKTTKKESQSPNVGAFLFRIMNFFKCQNVVQVGCSTGVMSLYLTMYSAKNNTCYLLEEREGLLQSLKDFSRQHNMPNVNVMEGSYEKSINKLEALKKNIDLIFLNFVSKEDKDRINELFLMCEPLIKRTNILIINDIKNKEIKKQWKLIRQSPEAKVCLDLYSLGVVFFDDKLPKKNYKVYFDYGKKQSLHKNRRRRIHFLSWRKKSSKNKLSH